MSDDTKLLVSFWIFGAFFIGLFWYLEKSGDCQQRAKAEQKFISYQTERECLYPQNWK